MPLACYAHSLPLSDGYIAAIARAHGFTVATRDKSTCEGVGVPVVTPGDEHEEIPNESVGRKNRSCKWLNGNGLLFDSLYSLELRSVCTRPATCLAVRAGNRAILSGIFSATFNGRKYGMKISTTIDGAGRVIVPASMRRRLNLTPGSRLQLEVVAERIELTPETEAQPLVRKAGRLVLKPSGKRTDAAALVRAEREAQARREPRR